MANIIWIVGVMCLLHDAQSSLPLLAEVKNRTRWCLGEGSHCPVILLFSLPSCCKPYVCTEVPKTCKPAFLLKFTHYTDHRCMLPSTPVTQEQKFHSNVSETESLFQDDEIISTDMTIVDNVSVEITTIQFDTNEMTANISNLNSGEYENYENPLSASNETYSESNETSHKNLVKRSITNNSSENSETNNSEHIYSHFEAGDINETNSLESGSSSSDSSNITSSSESETSAMNSKTSQALDSSGYSDFILSEGQNNLSGLDKLNNFSVTNSELKNHSIPADKYVLSNIWPSKTLPTLTNSSGVSEEEWTSSDMTYDTRPSLHKIVTIHPFRLFQSVELIRLNESVETSD